jgi:hypothetical protein
MNFEGKSFPKTKNVNIFEHATNGEGKIAGTRTNTHGGEMDLNFVFFCFRIFAGAKLFAQHSRESKR